MGISEVRTAAAVTVLPGPRDSAAAGAAARHRYLLPLLLAGQAMAAMDTSIANVAAPAMRADLGLSGAALQLAVAGYVLAYAVFLITGARLGDDHGYRRVFVLGVSIFTVSSLACGLAPSTGWLIAGRVAQGVGAALLVPQVLSLIQHHYTGGARARAIGYYSMILGLGATAGQLLGGVIVTVDLAGSSWRPAFLINVPIGIALVLLARRVIPDTRGERRRLDLAGVLTLSLSMLGVVVPLTFGQDLHWPAWTWASLAAGLLGLWGFWRYENALARRGGAPLLNLQALATPGIRAGLAVIATGFIGYGGWLFAAALYLQAGMGFSPLTSGLVFTAYALGFGISNLKWSSLPAAWLRWTPAASLGAMGLANLAFGATALGLGWAATAMVPLLFLAGGSHGLGFGTTVNQMTLRTAPAHAPAISGLVTTAVQLSIVLGIALLGALYLALGVAGDARTSSRAMAGVTFAIAIGAWLATVCAVRLARAPLAAAPADPARH